MPNSDRFVMDLELASVTDSIPSVRRLVTQAYSPVINDPDAISRIGLATHEMLENAMKYATGTVMRIRIAIQHQARIEIRTWNKTDSEHREVVAKMFEQMESAPDPMLFYFDLMRRNAHLEGSGLGLARIRAEAELDLAFEVDNDLLCIAASGPIEVAA